MQRLIPVCFLLLYGVAMVKPVAPLLDYYIRYELYSKKLCLNLSRPEMKCNGQCILMQRLKKAAEEEFPQLPASNLVNLKEYPIGIIDSKVISQTPDDGIHSPGRSVYILIMLPGLSSDIFHPPTC